MPHMTQIGMRQPNPGICSGERQLRIQNDAQQGCENDRALLAGLLPVDVETLVAGRCDL